MSRPALPWRARPPAPSRQEPPPEPERVVTQLVCNNTKLYNNNNNNDKNNNNTTDNDNVYNSVYKYIHFYNDMFNMKKIENLSISRRPELCADSLRSARRSPRESRQTKNK